MLVRSRLASAHPKVVPECGNSMGREDWDERLLPKFPCYQCQFKHWNRLPRKAVEFPSLEILKKIYRSRPWAIRSNLKALFWAGVWTRGFLEVLSDFSFVMILATVCTLLKGACAVEGAGKDSKGNKKYRFIEESFCRSTVTYSSPKVVQKSFLNKNLTHHNEQYSYTM